MLKKLIYVAGAAAMLALSAPSFAQGWNSHQSNFRQGNTHQQYRGDMRADRRDMRADRRSFRQDRRQGNRAGMRSERRDMRADRHDMRADRSGMRYDRFASAGGR